MLDASIVQAIVRQAVTIDPMRMRFENVVFSPFGCEPGGKQLHPSQVLTHVPLNPRDVGDEAARWEPSASYRVNVRQKGSPNGPFVERKPFDANDYTAFVPAAETGSALPWRSDDGTMHLQTPPADGARRYAIFGEPVWNHVQVRTDVDPQGGAASVAMGVAHLFAVTQSLIVLVDEPARRLAIVERSGGRVSERAAAALPDGTVAPYRLEVLAFERQASRPHQRNRRRSRSPRDSPRQAALVADGRGAFHSLVVEPLDAYRFQFQASRFVDFPAHIGSFAGDLGQLPADSSGLATETAATLLAATAADIDRVMTPDADTEARQRLFDRWISGLVLPLRTRTTKLELTRLVDGNQTGLLLLETPEPLPFSNDVHLELRKRSFALPLPQGGGHLPPFLRTISVSVDFEEDRIRLGPFPPGPETQPLGRLRWFVHAVGRERRPRVSRVRNEAATGRPQTGLGGGSPERDHSPGCRARNLAAAGSARGHQRRSHRAD